MDLNKVMIIGRLTRDPELRSTPAGDQVASLTIATSYNWKDKAGQRQEKSEFHNVVVWRKLAEICGQYLKKGSKIYIEGRLQSRSWEDQNAIKRYRTEIIADNMIMLDSRGAGSQNNEVSSVPVASAPEFTGDEEINVEDIPF